MENRTDGRIVYCLVSTLMLCFLLLIGCNNHPVQNNSYSLYVKDTAWGAYNVLVPPGSSPDDRQAGVLRLEKYLDSVINHHVAGTTFQLKGDYSVYYCPCDSNLLNIDAHLLAGAGTTYPPPPPPPKGGSGDGGTLTRYGFDFKVAKDSASEGAINPVQLNKIDLSNKRVDARKVLAIIDTGLDSQFFKNQPTNWIWSEGPQTLLNTLPGKPKDLWQDDHKYRHGTGVAGLVYQVSATDVVPQLMILKALDQNKEGSTFSVSCAMSYAIQHKVTAVNASLGYYAPTIHDDPIMQTYDSLCNAAKIPVFAAAGNVRYDEGLTSGACVDRKVQVNLLGAARSFFPASYAPQFPYLISVTGLKSLSAACPNQNYSEQLVKVGLYNKTNCCSYYLPFMPTGYTGSSFATPMVSGLVMKQAIANPNTDIMILLGDLERQDRTLHATVQGTYIGVTQPKRVQ